MSKPWKPGKETVELRPSRIRRDPVVVKEAESDAKLQWRTSDREIKLAIAGIVAFALAIDIIIVAVSTYWN